MLSKSCLNFGIPKKLYIANDGPSDNITGSGQPVLNIHQAHLDLLNRFSLSDV